MFCSRCGKPIPEGAAYCPSCGASVPAWSGAAPAAAAVPSGGLDTGTAPTVAAAPPFAAPTTPPADVIRYGGFWRRLVAYIVDGLLIGAATMPFGLGLGFAQMSAMMSGDITPDMLAALFMASLFVGAIRFVLSWAYAAGFESSPWQATPGKMLLGLKVTDLDGRRITFLRATGRFLGKVISGILLGMGFVLAAFTDRKQGLHDLMARTLVRR